jgi:large conductance mechanosensitive channel
VKKIAHEYLDFIKKGDVIMVAVGLVMALYFKAIVDQIIAATIKPLIALIVGKQDFASIGFTISDTFFPVGLILGALIDFVAVAAILFLVVKAYNHLKGGPAEDGPTEVDLLTEIRDQLKANNNPT